MANNINETDSHPETSFPEVHFQMDPELLELRLLLSEQEIELQETIGWVEGSVDNVVDLFNLEPDEYVPYDLDAITEHLTTLQSDCGSALERVAKIKETLIEIEMLSDEF